MNSAIIFFVASACLCFLLAAFAGHIFRWSNRLTRKLGFNKLTEFREKLWPVLGPIARIVLVLTGIMILVLTWKLITK